ncbi:unnamed protein product [Brachionus calyciflorus]|uniref:vitamin-K-epoxide reductase (warfarin-sensitive) n=1 Tax=Brachionus calyciflorus TaxID=104777 RepID=A0A813M7J9_9BILA|nr:unnamed protein product [Brachionus calyciflorus]
MSLLQEQNFYINIFSSIGLLIALYSYYVKVKYLKNPNQFRAWCDINDKMSCSKVITSKYGSGFGIVGKLFGENSSLNVSNSLLGGVFYGLQIVFTFYNENDLVQFFGFSSSFLSIVGSIYLAYILYFVLKDFCIVCNLSYLVNAFIFYFNWTIFMNNLN